jgi:hypothetical protein
MSCKSQTHNLPKDYTTVPTCTNHCIPCPSCPASRQSFARNAHRLRRRPSALLRGRLRRLDGAQPNPLHPRARREAGARPSASGAPRAPTGVGHGTHDPPPSSHPKLTVLRPQGRSPFPGTSSRRRGRRRRRRRRKRRRRFGGFRFGQSESDGGADAGAAGAERAGADRRVAEAGEPPCCMLVSRSCHAQDLFRAFYITMWYDVMRSSCGMM